MFCESSKIFEKILCPCKDPPPASYILNVRSLIVTSRIKTRTLLSSHFFIKREVSYSNKRNHDTKNLLFFDVPRQLNNSNCLFILSQQEKMNKSQSHWEPISLL